MIATTKRGTKMDPAVWVETRAPRNTAVLYTSRYTAISAPPGLQGIPPYYTRRCTTIPAPRSTSHLSKTLTHPPPHPFINRKWNPPPKAKDLHSLVDPTQRMRERERGGVGGVIYHFPFLLPSCKVRGKFINWSWKRCIPMWMKKPIG